MFQHQPRSRRGLAGSRTVLRIGVVSRRGPRLGGTGTRAREDDTTDSGTGESVEKLQTSAGLALQPPATRLTRASVAAIRGGKGISIGSVYVPQVTASSTATASSRP